MEAKALMLEMYKAGKWNYEEQPKAFFTALFQKPPEQALKYLKSRGEQLVQTEKWDELSKQAHTKAFTVAKVMSADILQDIHNALVQAKSEGLSSDEFKSLLGYKLEKKGWSGSSPSRAAIIYRTNIQTAYSAQRYKEQSLLKEKYPYLRYLQVQRPTKGHDHSHYHNNVYRIDDPNIGVIYPPSRHGCICAMVQLSKEEVEALGLTVSKAPDGENQLSSINEWKPDVTKYVNGIRKQLKQDLAKVKQVSKEIKTGVPDKHDVKTQQDVETAYKNLFKEYYPNVKIQVEYNSAITFERYNNRLDHLKKLFSTYNVARFENQKAILRVMMTSNLSSYGWIRSSPTFVSEYNMGHKTDKAHSNEDRKTGRMFKSPINKEYEDVGTLYHEFGHVLFTYKFGTKYKLYKPNDPNGEAYYKAANYFKGLLTRYKREVKKGNNDVYMGDYSFTNVNEFIAEGFKEYKLLSNPSKYAKAIGEKLDELFKRKRAD